MNEKSSFDDFIRPNRYLMNFMGFWPEESGYSDTFKSFRIIVSITMIFLILIPEILSLFVYWGDIIMLTTIGSIFIQVIQFLFKMFYILTKREQFCELYESTRRLWFIADDNKERENFEKLPKLAYRLTISLFIMYFSNVFTFTFLSILITLNNYKQANGSDYVRFLPLDMWYGFNIQRSPHYQITLCCQLVTMVYGAVGIPSFDATMVTLILHVSNQFRLISARFRKIEKEIKSTSEYKLKLNIRQQIEHHKLILGIASDVREQLSPIIFVQLVSSSFELCLAGYSLLTTDGSNIETAKYIFFLLTMLLQLTLWCWPGEVMIQESISVGNVICQEMSLYKLPTAIQRDLVFVVARAQRQCCITALDFQVMSMKKLSEVFNTAISYLAVLRSITTNT